MHEQPVDLLPRFEWFPCKAAFAGQAATSVQRFSVFLQELLLKVALMNPNDAIGLGAEEFQASWGEKEMDNPWSGPQKKAALEQPFDAWYHRDSNLGTPIFNPLLYQLSYGTV